MENRTIKNYNGSFLALLHGLYLIGVAFYDMASVLWVTASIWGVGVFIFILGISYVLYYVFTVVIKENYEKGDIALSYFTTFAVSIFFIFVNIFMCSAIWNSSQ